MKKYSCSKCKALLPIESKGSFVTCVNCGDAFQKNFVYKFNYAQNKLLTEIYRRLNYLNKGDVNTTLLWLEYPSIAKKLISIGIVEPSGNEIVRALNWYKLTDDGKRLFLKNKPSKPISDQENRCMFDGELVKDFSDNATN